MKKIEEMSFTVDKSKCTFKLYEYEEPVIRKVRRPAKFDEITLHMGYVEEEIKVNRKKYALHREYEKGDDFNEILICETESYACILSVIKDILEEHIKTITKYGI